MNRVCEILECRYPIIEGGLAYVGNGALAAAVSDAGGFGQVGAGGRTPEDFESQIRTALDTTDRPVGVNLPLSEHRDPRPYLDVVVKYAARLKAISLSAGNPRPYIAPLKERGLRVITLASTPVQAQKAEASGADIVVCEGTEAGGHNGPAELTTMALIPNVAGIVNVPVVAAGGIADGRTALAAMLLGAEGIQMGTRFVATTECQAHPNYKDLLRSATVDDTVVMERSLGRVTRVLKSPFSERVLMQEKETPGDLDRLLPMISGRMNAVAAIEGRVDEGWMNCGQSVGLIRQVLSAREVIEQVVAEMRELLSGRVQQVLSWL